MSTLNVDSIADQTGTGPVTLTGQSAAKAWGNINGATPAFRDSVNVSSLTDNATGDFTFNFSAAFAASDYAFVTGIRHSSGNTNTCGTDTGGYSTTTCRCKYMNQSYTGLDADTCNMTAHGDLA